MKPHVLTLLLALTLVIFSSLTSVKSDDKKSADDKASTGDKKMDAMIEKKEDSFPTPINNQPANDQPGTAQEALAKIKVPEGFSVQLFASEPEVNQPISINYDHKGRLWVSECYTYGGYPGWANNLRDRVIILEDKDNDGKADERKVFWDKGNRLSSALTGFGGLYILNDGALSFIPDLNEDDVPDSEPQVLLDGFNKEEITHNIVNGLFWGHDGWLYGRQGIQATSFIGPPGSPRAERTSINCSIWRFHPVTHQFELVAQGTTNPWGFDYNDIGEYFFTNNVIGHLWHVMPGAHYHRMYGSDFNPYVYELIEQTADHFHWNNSKTWQDSRAGEEADELGGGHSHCGGMIYQAKLWPEKFYNSMLMCNTHGHRINIDYLEEHQSGFSGKHRGDFFFASDAFFRGVSIVQTPDANIIVSDWVEHGECHDNDGVHRTSGRLYKVTYGEAEKPVAKIDLSLLSSEELAKLQLHTNDWWCRMARLVLQERAVKGDNLDATAKVLHEIYETQGDVTRKLRALWCLDSINKIDNAFLTTVLNQDDYHLRNWAVKALGNHLVLAQNKPDQVKKVTAEIAQALATAAAKENKPMVRLALASISQYLPPADRFAILTPITRHLEDHDDRTLSLMFWYAAEPAVPLYPQAALELALTTRIPFLQESIARRLASEIKSSPALVTQLIDTILKSDEVETQVQLLAGFNKGLSGWRKIKAPSNWETLYQKLSSNENAEMQKLLRELALVFGEGKALTELMSIAQNDKGALADREQALKTLIEEHPPELKNLLIKLVSDRSLEGWGVRGLAEYDDPKIPGELIGKYQRFHPDVKRDAIVTLTSRVAFARELLKAVEQNKIPVADISAVDARQINNFKDEKLSAILSKVWGDLRDSSEEKNKTIEELKQKLTKAELAKADLVEGRMLFAKNCSNCHKLFGTGGTIGPDITGSNRDSIDYLLENIIDPSRIVGKMYRMSLFVRTDGKMLTGIILNDANDRYSIQQEKELLTLSKDDVLEMKDSDKSMMPDGVIEKLKPEEVRNLFGYLQSRTQVKLPDEK
jgi:putative membrane-bound dehydrogenase-like protein